MRETSGRLPEAVEAERSILGTILMFPESWHQAKVLSRDDFSLDAHRRIFSHMNKLAEDESDIDRVVLADSLSNAGELESIGGRAYLSSLPDGLPFRANIEQYVRIVKEKAALRNLIFCATNIVARATEQDEEASAIITDAQAKFMALLVGNSRQFNARPLREVMQSVFSEFETFKDWTLDQQSVGLSTGLDRLTKILGGGYRRGEYHLIGGYTGDGKSSMAIMTIIEAINAGWPVLFLSHEMDARAVAHRILAATTNVSFSHLRDPRELHQFERDDLNEARKVLEGWNLWIEDSGSMEIGQLRSLVRLHVKRDKVALVIVDFLQKVKVNGVPRDKKHIAMSEVSEGLRDVAKTENVALIALSQFSQPDDKKKKAPGLFSFKESGDPVNDSHVALAVYRPTNENGRYTDQDSIIVLKQRSGPCNTSVCVKYNTDRLIYEEPS